MFSVSISPTTKSLVNQTSNISASSSNKQKNNSSEVESDVKPLHSKALIGQPQVKLRSFGNHTTFATTTLKTHMTTYPEEARKKSDYSEKNDIANIPTFTDSTLIPPTATPDHRASKRSFIRHSMDTVDHNDFDFTVPHYSPPPPPAPPSSTPLLPPPSSTTLIPSFPVVSMCSPTINDPLNLVAGLHPGNHIFRY